MAGGVRSSPTGCSAGSCCCCWPISGQKSCSRSSWTVTGAESREADGYRACSPKRSEPAWPPPLDWLDLTELNEIPSGLLFLVAAALWALLAVIVCSEFNLLHIARSRLRQLAGAGNRSAQLADTLLRDPERLRRVVRIAETLLIVGIV